jgi:hypothetical protein
MTLRDHGGAPDFGPLESVALRGQVLLLGRNPRAAGAVLVVLAYRDLDGDLHGMTAWPAASRALRLDTDGRTA